MTGSEKGENFTCVFRHSARGRVPGRRGGRGEGGGGPTSYPDPVRLVLEGDKAVALAVARVAVLAYLGRKDEGMVKKLGREGGREGERVGGREGGTHLRPHDLAPDGILEVFLEADIIRVLREVSYKELETQERHFCSCVQEGENEDWEEVICRWC